MDSSSKMIFGSNPGPRVTPMEDLLSPVDAVDACPQPSPGSHRGLERLKGNSGFYVKPEVRSLKPYKTLGGLGKPSVAWKNQLCFYCKARSEPSRGSRLMSVTSVGLRTPLEGRSGGKGSKIPLAFGGNACRTQSMEK